MTIDRAMTRIYIGNLSRTTDEAMLRELLSRDGRTVTNVLIKKNATTGKPRGFAFADMGSPEEAEATIGALRGAVLDGRAIKVGNAKDLPTRESAASDYGSNYFGSNRGGRRGSRR